MPQTKHSDLKVQTDDQLAGALQELKREQFNLRFQAATGQLEKPGRIREVRRTIARITTLQAGRKPPITQTAAAQPGAQ